MSSSTPDSALRALLSKLLPLAQPLALKVKLMQTMMARTIAAATGGAEGATATAAAGSSAVAIAAPSSPASSSSSSAAQLFALVHSLCAVGEEWMSCSVEAASAAEGASATASHSDRIHLQCACGAAVLSSLASPIAATTASPVTARAHSQMRAAFVSYYSRDHMRSLVPPMPWHQDATATPAALRLIALVLRLLTPLLPANELVYRMQAVRDCMQFLLAADPPPASLIPHPAVSCSLAQLWIHAADTCPDAPRMRMDLAVRWLCMLPSNPSPSDAERTRLTKDALVQFIAQPWLAASAADAAPVASGSDFTVADKQALDTLETVFVLQMGAPLLATENGEPAPLPAIYAADLIRTIPLRYTAAASERARMFALAVKPAILMPPVLHPDGSSSPSALVVPGLPTESNLIAAMLSMIDWGLDPRIEPWVSALVDGICLASKFDLLRHFATTYAHSHILPQLARTHTRTGAFNLLRKLLLGDSTQPAAFLACVNGLVKVTEGIKKECEEAAAPVASAAASASPAAPALPFLRSYSLLLRSLMYCHTGHPTEYVPLVEALNQLETVAALIYAPAPAAAASAAAAAATAMDTTESQSAMAPPATAAVALPSSFALLPTEREMMEEQKRGAWVGAAAAAASSSSAASGALTWSARSKSSTGKTGLDNLGNSCYLNSVLQSLYMTDSFRSALLGIQRAKVGYTFIRDHPILTNLQSIFGFLLLSNRASYAPQTLFRALPEMFRDATQQDAGEFAKYVLDSVGASLKKLRELQSEQNKAAAAAAVAAGVNSNAPTAPSTPASATPTPIDSDVSMTPAPLLQPVLASATAPQTPSRGEAMQAITVHTRSSEATPMEVEQGMKGGSAATLATMAPIAADSASTAVLATLAPVASDAAATAAAAAAPAKSTNVAILQDAFFGGEFLSELTCRKCGTCSAKKEGFVEIPLALEIELVQPPAAPAAPTAPAASSSSSASSAPSASSASNAAGPLKPGMAAALQLAQAEADQPLTSLAQLGSELHSRSAVTGAAVSDQAAADISKLVGSFLPSDSSSSMEDDDASFLKDVIASTLPAAAAPSAAATDAASNMAMAAMLAMAAGQVVQSTMIATAVAAAAANSVQQANNDAAGQGEQAPTAASAASVLAAAAAPAPAAAAPPASTPAAAAPAAAPPKSPPAPTHVVPRGPLHLSAMLDHYFSPELLTGSNAYFCSTCQSKQDASKQLQLLQAPSHLLMCLKRNTYEFKAGAIVRNKIMKEVQYPCVLQVPVLQIDEAPSATAASGPASASSSVSPPSKAPRRTILKPYVLYSVIVHSGTSAQHGHYYAISRQSDEEALAQFTGVERSKLTQTAASADSDSSSSSAASTAAASASSTVASSAVVDAELELRAQSGAWYQFNDSSVSPASFGALANLTKTLPSDVAYLLFYRAIDEGTEGDATANRAASVTASAHRSVDQSLFQTVQSDNQRFMSELERSAQVRMALTAMEKNYAKRGAGADNGQDDADFRDPDMG